VVFFSRNFISMLQFWQFRSVSSENFVDQSITLFKESVPLLVRSNLNLNDSKRTYAETASLNIYCPLANSSVFYLWDPQCRQQHQRQERLALIYHTQRILLNSQTGRTRLMCLDLSCAFFSKILLF